MRLERIIKIPKKGETNMLATHTLHHALDADYE
jgi:hypothetical protein